MVAPRSQPDPLVAEAVALYEARLKDHLEPHENGKFLVLNLDSGEYELDVNDLAAARRASARFGKARLITLRVGGPAAYRLGSAAPPA